MIPCINLSPIHVNPCTCQEKKLSMKNRKEKNQIEIGVIEKKGRKRSPCPSPRFVSELRPRVFPKSPVGVG